MPRKQSKVGQPNWRPDFRVKDQLPDIKVVRTNFILNVVSVLIAVLVLGTLVYREYTAAEVRERIDSISAQNEGKRAQDRENVTRSGAFVKELAVAEDAASFLQTPVHGPRLLTELAETLPEQGRFNSISIQELEFGEKGSAEVGYRVNLNGAMSASGTRKAVQLIDDYIRSLREIERLAPYIRRIELLSAERNTGIDQFIFSIVIELNAVPAKQS